LYIPKLYRNNNIEEVREFISQNGFAIIASSSGKKIEATHIPLLLDRNEAGRDILHGHMSKANPQWKNFTEGDEILAIFQGAHTYVSSSWYEHENVPTWNYLAVHIYGKIHIYDEASLLKSLTKLVDKYEANSEHPVSVPTMSEKVMKENLGGVVGFEIEITEIYYATKLSQNQNDRDHENIIHELKKTGNPDAERIAGEMYKNRNTQ
jgi:transcriptional regulator